MKISFHVSDEQYNLIIKIARRAEKEIFCKSTIKQTQLDTIMDLSATIAQGVQLKLQDLLNADSFNFAHDICGIQQHLNRKTGKLKDCFLPRYVDVRKENE